MLDELEELGRAASTATRSSTRVLASPLVEDEEQRAADREALPRPGERPAGRHAPGDARQGPARPGARRSRARLPHRAPRARGHQVEVEVTTAVPLSAELRERMLAAARARGPARRIELIEQVDPALLGGLVVRVGRRQARRQRRPGPRARSAPLAAARLARRSTAACPSHRAGLTDRQPRSLQGALTRCDSGSTRSLRSSARRSSSTGSEVDLAEVGKVLEVGDGIARVYGLCATPWRASCSSSRTAPSGQVFNLEESSVGVVILGDYLGIKEGDEVRRTGELLSRARRRGDDRPRRRPARPPARRPRA